MPRWTDETRKAQSERLLSLKPWEKSTGPKTEEGKKLASMNNLKHGMRSEAIKELRRVLKLQKEFLKGL